MRQEERAGTEIVKLAAVVALDALNGDPELSANISEKVRQSGKGVRLRTKRKGP